MAKVKAHQAPQVKAENEQDSTTPSRRTRRQTKSLVEHQDARNSEPEDFDEVESARAPSPPPIVKPKAKRTSRKSNAAKASASLAGSASPEPAPKLAKDGRRKGGNKRKFSHEYCLTCENYGRACLGRREDEPGCAMCREPDREKGEKLRECLWKDPQAGIITYQDARQALKKAQAEAKVQKPRAPRRTIPVAHLDRASPSPFNYLNAPDPLGIVPHPQAVRGSRPALTRPLDLLPPSHATGTYRPPSMNGYHAYTSQAMARTPADNSDTITVNASRHARNRSHPDLPGVHPPEVIDLQNGNGTYDEHSRRASMPQPVHYFTPPTLPAGHLTPLPESFAPFYEPRLHAYVLPVHPYSNLLPPPAFMRPHAASYISPYDAAPSLTLSTNGRDPPRAVFPTQLPPRNTGFTIPPLLNMRSKKARPLDKSGAPCEKWSRSNSKVTTLSGHEFNTKGWTRGANGSGSAGSQESGIEMLNGNAVSSNAVSIETGTRKSVESSELSSALDVDESMLAATPQNNGGEAEADTAEGVDRPAHDAEQSSVNTPQHSDDETESEAEEEEETDRAQAFVKKLYNEKIKGLKRQRISSPKTTTTSPAEEQPARNIAVSPNYDDSDLDPTESEGENKVIPPNMRAALAKAASFVHVRTNFLASERNSQRQVGRGRVSSIRRSTASSHSHHHHEDAAEQPARANGFAAVAVNSKRKTKGAVSRERKRETLADVQGADVEMGEA